MNTGNFPHRQGTDTPVTPAQHVAWSDDRTPSGAGRRCASASGPGSASGAAAPAEATGASADVAAGTPRHSAALASRPGQEAAAALMGLDLGTRGARDPLQRITRFSVVLDEQPAEVVARGADLRVDLLAGHNADWPAI